MVGSFFRFINQFWSNRPISGKASTVRRRPHLNLEALEERAVPALIGGYIYYDQSNSGIMTSADPGIANQSVILEDANGHTLSTTTTDSNGHYQFSTNQTINTTPETQKQVVNFSSSITGNSQTQAIQQFNSALGTLTSVDILENGNLTSDIKVESTDQSSSTIQAKVSGILTLQIPGQKNLVTNVSGTPVTTNVGPYDGTIDFAGTSGHDFGNDTVSGSGSETLSATQTDLSSFIGTGKINLTNLAASTSSASGPGNLIANITSSSSAQVTIVYHYVPGNALTPGNYKVVEPNVPSGYLPGQLTSNNQTPIPNSVGQNTIPVTLTSNNSLQNNFGNLKASSLSGYVYHDANDNGVMDPGEQGISGVQVQLTGKNDLGTSIQLTQVTGKDGSYDFTNLRPGTYTITKVNTPSGYIDGMDTLGSQGGQVGNNQFSQIVLNSGVQGTNNNFGEYKSSSLSGYEYVDKSSTGIMTNNDPGIANVRILLTGTDINGNQVNQSTVTSSTGFYQFSNLIQGNYTITQIPPVGYLDGPINVGSLGGTASRDAINVPVGLEQSGTNYNFGHPAPSIPVIPPNIPNPIPINPNNTPPNLSKFWLIF